MKDYNAMLKKDLIKELKEHEHLSQAIEAKDKEISSLKKQIDEGDKKFTQDYVDALKKEKQDLELKLSKSINPEQFEIIKKDLNDAVKLANLYIVAYNDSLKQRKISLDMEIFTNELMTEKLKKE